MLAAAGCMTQPFAGVGLGMPKVPLRLCAGSVNFSEQQTHQYLLQRLLKQQSIGSKTGRSLFF
jgi:hypothetical protein